MSFYLKALLALVLVSLFSFTTTSVFAADSGPGPAGIPLIEYLFARIICVTVPLGYVVLLVVLIIAGFKYLVSGGEAKTVSSAHQTVTWGLLGILFLAIAWLILLLIQNFTGVEVTKFSVSSLPGVQGFTGSCWEKPPTAPEPPKPTIAATSTPTPPNQTPIISAGTKAISCYWGNNVDDVTETMAREWKHNIVGSGFGLQQTGRNRVLVCMFSCSTQTHFVPIDPNSTNVISYRSISDLEKLKNALDKQKYIHILIGSMDNVLYEPKEGSQTLTFLSDLWAKEFSTYYIRMPTGQIPSDYLNSVYKARKIADSIAQKTGRNVLGSIDFISLNSVRCSGYDYYPTVVISPLLYLYPQHNLSLSVKINSPLVSKIGLDNNGYWNVVAIPDGTLTTLDGKKHPYIPYEFLRSDFKRPNKGFVVSSDNLEGFLKTNLWKKLGLKNNEINDYWIDTKPRVPKASYYFVSLIERSEIDRVLPMQINPLPETIIRNMTYILPLSLPVIPQPLEEEQLKSPERFGFTVLENGVFVDGT